MYEVFACQSVQVSSRFCSHAHWSNILSLLITLSLSSLTFMHKLLEKSSLSGLAGALGITLKPIVVCINTTMGFGEKKFLREND